MINLRCTKKGFFICLAVITMGILINFNTFAGQANSNETNIHLEVVASGAVGVGGAPWRLYGDGRIEVGEGFINWTGGSNPWHDYSDQINRIIFTGSITAGTSLQGLFHFLVNVETIEGLGYFNTSNVTNMSVMFAETQSLTELDISEWDTSNVVDMSDMFSRASSLTELDITNWETSNVENMSGMFFATHALREIDLSNWETGNVTDMSGMFRYTHSLTELDISNWDTSNVVSMQLMFLQAAITA